MKESIPQVAKDLILDLIKKNPTERLGNRNPDPLKSIQELKDHPFFEGIVWETQSQWTSPFHIEKQKVEGENEAIP